MAINKPLIAAGPTAPRDQITQKTLQVIGANPGETIQTVDESGNPVTITVGNPERVGQVYVSIKFADSRNKIAVMYVGVDIEGTLTWVPADMNRRINGYTGQKFDPMRDG